jgi:hypothetical protein
MPTCQICGRQPAAELTVRRHVGMIILQRFVRFRGTLCRAHGIAMANDFLRKTLVQGWWGMISFFVNFYAIYTDLAALSKAKKLGPPMGTPAHQHPQPASAWDTTQPQPAGWSGAPPLPPPPVPTG